MDRLPLHIHVRDSIIEGIEKGLITPDSKGMLPGQQSFADRYNVSLMTIKKAIRELEEMGLVESRRGKGLILKSFPGSGGQDGVVTERMLHVGVLFPDTLASVGNPVVAKLLQGIENGAEEHHLVLHALSFPSLNVNLQEDTLFCNFPFANLDGVLLLTSISSNAISKIKERQMPMVVCGLVSDDDVICCLPDIVTLSYQVSDVILGRGCRHIAVFPGNRNQFGAGMKLSSHKMALAKHGLELDMDYVSDEDYDRESAVAFVQGLLDKGKKVDAVFAFDDIVAAAIHDHLTANGHSDVLIAGIGNLDLYRDKVMITCDIRLEETGYDMIRFLVESIKGISPTRTKHLYEAKVIER